MAQKITAPLLRAAGLLLVFALVCGFGYPLLVTGASQLLFPDKANGGLIEAGGVEYGSRWIAQPFSGEAHLWGRIILADTESFRDPEGNPLLYAWPSNQNPADSAYGDIVAERVKKIRQAHPEKGNTPIPSDLVTVSGSGLDPHISPAAAEYQVERLARATGRPASEIRDIIAMYTEKRFLGLFGEERVQVLQVNLALDGLL